MKKALLLIALLCAGISAKADFSNINQTATTLSLDFKLVDNALSYGGDTDTFDLGAFPGVKFVFTFTDKVFFFGGDQETFTTLPSSGAYTFNRDCGTLNFQGSYTAEGQTIFWNVVSTVTTNILANDTWQGKLTATVPDSSATVALLGLGLLGLAAYRRKLA